MEEIRINAAAAAYIKEQGGIIYLDKPLKISACCGSVTFAPFVRVGLPDNTADFQMVIADGINVFLPLTLQLHFEITVILHSILWFKWLSISGWKLI